MQQTLPVIFWLLVDIGCLAIDESFEDADFPDFYRFGKDVLALVVVHVEAPLGLGWLSLVEVDQGGDDVVGGGIIKTELI